METAAYILASFCALLLLALRAAKVRGLTSRFALGLDLALLLMGAIASDSFIQSMLRLPVDAGDHDPGAGVALLPLLLICGVCSLFLLLRLAALSLRALARPRSMSATGKPDLVLEWRQLGG